MSVSISTSDYKKVITAEIDGVEFKVTPMSSAQGIAYINLSEDLKQAQKDKDLVKVKDTMAELYNVLFGVFDKPEKAREILSSLSIESVIKIYQKIVGEE